MKTEAFKTLIKESLKEVIKEELSLELRKIIREEILLSSPPKPINEVQISSNQSTPNYKPIMNQLNSEMAQLFSNPSPITPSPAQPFRPSPVSTVAEGSALPPGEVSLDQITKLLINK
jgi:hypothetical protein